MSRIYTDIEARKDLDAVLDEVERDGEVRIHRRNGKEYVVREVAPQEQGPIDYEQRWRDLPVIDIGLTTDEIVQIVREGRERQYEWLDDMTFDPPADDPK